MQFKDPKSESAYSASSDFKIFTIHLDKNEKGDTEDIDVYFHEAQYVLCKGEPLEEDAIIVHRDLNTLNNDLSNLCEIQAPSDGIETTRRKLFHKPFIYDEFNQNIIKEHFPDIYEQVVEKLAVPIEDENQK